MHIHEQAQQDGMDPWFASHYTDAARMVHGFLADCLPLAGARVLDFGCGDGSTALGLCRLGVGAVVGVDINAAFCHLKEMAQANLGQRELPSNLSFVRVGAGLRLPFADGSFDAAYAWSIFEHLPDVAGTLADLRRVLRPGGCCLIQIDPLYHSAFGSHLDRLVSIPWGHLLESTAAFIRRAEQATDIADGPGKHDLLYRLNDFSAYKKHLIGQFLELNRLTIRQLAHHIRNSGLTVVRALAGRLPQQIPVPEVLLGVYDPQDLLVSSVYMVLRNDTCEDTPAKPERAFPGFSG